MNKGPLTQLGKYHILEKIASGGMATVHRARLDLPEGASRVVALKVLHPHLAEDPDYVAMFQDEGRLMRRLDHPNLLGAFDHGTVEGWHFIAMELLPCVSLAALCDHLDQRKRAMELPDALFVISEVLAGLAAAHDLTDERGVPLGIIHRDVSPQNVLLTTGGQVKLIDFGIARVGGPGGTQWGVLLGTPNYMAPEQRRIYDPGPIDGRADVYALGVVVCEMLTGQMPFHRFDTLSGREWSMGGDREPLPEAPAPIERVLRKALAHDPDRRYPSAAAFAAALRAAVDDVRSRVAAAETAAPERRRHPWRAVAVAASVLAAAVAATLGTWLPPVELPVTTPSAPPSRAAGLDAPPAAIRIEEAVPVPAPTSDDV